MGGECRMDGRSEKQNKNFVRKRLEKQGGGLLSTEDIITFKLISERQ
jgi:hypothetical protein